MTPDPQEPETLLSVSNEIEAAAIVTALAEYDIEAMAVGGYTSGFRAEAPGTVALVVKRTDFEQAKRALAEIRQQQAQIDWASVNVAEDMETQLPENESPRTASSWAVSTLRVWWVLCLLGLATSIVVWLSTRETDLLVKIVGEILILGVALGLPLWAIGRTKT